MDAIGQSKTRYNLICAIRVWHCFLPALEQLCILLRHASPHTHLSPAAAVATFCLFRLLIYILGERQLGRLIEKSLTFTQTANCSGATPITLKDGLDDAMNGANLHKCRQHLILHDRCPPKAQRMRQIAPAPMCLSPSSMAGTNRKLHLLMLHGGSAPPASCMAL